jgi:hypothetical protein
MSATSTEASLSYRACTRQGGVDGGTLEWCSDEGGAVLTSGGVVLYGEGTHDDQRGARELHPVVVDEVRGTEPRERGSAG